MGRQREILPPVPLSILSEQQKKVYSLAKSHSTGEIAELLSIPQKQVRQVYSAIRRKSDEYANKYVPLGKGGKSAHFYPLTDEVISRDNSFQTEFIQGDGSLNLTSYELFVLEQLQKGITIREISRLTGKTAEALRKTHQRVKRKLSKKSTLPDGDSITRIDTGKTRVKIDFGLVRQAAESLNISWDQISGHTGIPVARIAEIEKDGTLNYDELFLLIKKLGFNPYGPSEKDMLSRKLKDKGWIKAVRRGKAWDGHLQFFSARAGKEKAKYRNRVMYYGTACYRYHGCHWERPVIEDGRGGFFPLTLTREQRSRCGWLLKRLMLKPVFTYRYTELQREMKGLDQNQITLLESEILQENGRSIYLVNKFQMAAIKHALFPEP